MSINGSRHSSEVERRILGALEALSSGIRLDIFRLLVSNEPSGLVAGEISAMLKIPPTNLSFHLKALSQSGLLTVTPEGRFLRYRARTETVQEVIEYLMEKCCLRPKEETASQGTPSSSIKNKSKG